MPGTPAPNPSSDEHITLLDMIVVVAESWKLLLLVPLVIALIAFGIASFRPSEYRSSLSLAVAPDALAAYLASEGMNEMAIANGVAVSQLESDLSLAPISSANPNRGTLVVARSDGTGMTSGVLETLANNVIQAVEDGRIVLPYDRVGAKLTEIRESIAFYSGTMTELAEELRETSEREAAVERIAVANTMSQTILVVGELELTEAELMRMQSSLSSQPVVAGPTEARRANVSPALTAVLAALTMGLLLLILIFVREGVRRSSLLPGGAEKLDRIRRAFAFRRTKA